MEDLTCKDKVREARRTMPNHAAGPRSSNKAKKDQEGKHEANEGPSHPVALIIGEHVPYPTNVHEQTDVPAPNNGGAASSPTAHVPPSGCRKKTPIGSNNHSSEVHLNNHHHNDTNNTDRTNDNSAAEEKQMANPNAVLNAEVDSPSNTAKKDNERKQEANQGPSHPVTLIIGEHVPYPTNVYEQAELPEPNNDDAVRSPKPTANVTPSSSSGKKARYNAIIDDNGIIPGAVRVAGMNRSVEFDAEDVSQANAAEPSYNESSSHLLQDGQTMNSSFALEIDGFVPSVIEPKYLVPEENVQRIEHMYASIEPTEPTSPNNNDREQHHRHHFMKKYLNKICLFGALVVLIISGIVLIAVCGRGICHRDNQESQSGQQNNDFKSSYKSFDTRQELFDAVDQLLSSLNISSLEQTYGSITNWNVSQIQDFSNLFCPYVGKKVLQKSFFNEDISRWDVSSAINMSYMFYGARAFRGDISKWNVSRVTDMQYFMAVTDNFDGNLSKWDTSQFVNTSHMFFDASNFTGIGVENWNVGRVYDMTSMFVSSGECHTYLDGSTSYCKIFTKFNGNLSTWDVSNVHYMAVMFQNAVLFQGVGIEDWDTSHVETMSWMFGGASSFDANLSKWNVSNVIDTSYMFAMSSFQGGGIQEWDTSKVTTMSFMFLGASSFDANLSKWNVSNVIDTSYIFSNAASFKGVGLEDWDTSKVQTMNGMFCNASSFDANLSMWNLSNVQDTSDMFNGATSFQGVGTEDWDTSKIETMSAMFTDASSFDANLSSWDVANVVDMSCMFQGTTSFRGDGLDVWNVRHVNNTVSMFESATAFHANLSNWDVSNIKNAAAMFLNATSFEGVFWWNETTDAIMNQTTMNEIK